MCGIFGVLKLKNYKKENNEQVLNIFKKIAIESDSRGGDASGFAYIADNKINVVKDKVVAKDLLNSKQFNKFI